MDNWEKNARDLAKQCDELFAAIEKLREENHQLRVRLGECGVALLKTLRVRVQLGECGVALLKTQRELDECRDKLEPYEGGN